MNSWHIEIASPEPTDTQASYVGMLRDKRTGQGKLHLPIGYALPANPDPYQHLGIITRTLAHFCNLHARQAAQSPHDGMLEGESGKHLADGSGPFPGLSRMRACLELIRRLKDPYFLSTVRKPGLSSQFSDRHISRALEYAHFLPDGTPVFEQMWGSKRQLGQNHEEYSGLAVWIALDALTHLFPDMADSAFSHGLKAEWRAIASYFAGTYRLHSDASLYAGNADQTLLTLRAALDKISTQAPAIVSSTRDLQHLLDVYLNHDIGGSGDIRGVAGFYQVWEAVCIHYARQYYGDDQIFTCDVNFAHAVPASTRKRWQDNQERVFARNGIARKPDLVVCPADGRYTLIDFKYSRAYESDSSFFSSRPKAPDFKELKPTPQSVAAFTNKLKQAQDVHNVETYRWLLMQHELQSPSEGAIAIEFWVPGMAQATTSVVWKARRKELALAGSGFQGFSIRHQCAATLIQAYAQQFQLL